MSVQLVVPNEQRCKYHADGEQVGTIRSRKPQACRSKEPTENCSIPDANEASRDWTVRLVHPVLFGVNQLVRDVEL